MISCKDLTELVTDYMEGNMTFCQRLSFQLHVGMCRPCREYLRQVTFTVQTMGCLAETAAAPLMPAEVQEELLQRFRDWKTG